MTSQQNRKVRDFIVKSFLRINQTDPEILAIYQDKLYELGSIIKQNNPELFELIIKHWTSEWSNEKIKVEINRQGRKK